MVGVLVFVARVATCSAQQVTRETTKGVFTIDMHREWAPIGYDRFIQVYRTIKSIIISKFKRGLESVPVSGSVPYK